MEQNQQYNQEIIEILKKSRTSYATVLKFKKSCKHLLDYILGWCQSVGAPADLPFPSMIYWTINGLHEQPKCSNAECNNRLPTNARCFPLTGFGYRCCSNSCAQRDPKHKEEQEKKSLAKYGTKRPQQAECNRRRMREALASKPRSHWEEANKKRVATLQKDYGAGVINVSQLESHKKSVSETWSLKSLEEIESITRSRKSTKLEKYGDENYCNSKKISETRKSFSEVEKLEIHEKTKATNMRNYGVEYVWHLDEVKLKSKLQRCKSKYDKDILLNDIAEPLFTFEEYVSNVNAKFKWKCKSCGDVFECGVYEHQPYVARCLKCNPLSSSHSKNETAIAEFLKINGCEDIVDNTRDIIPPKELDIFIPSKHLAIEYNGIWWHSLANGTPLDYHQSKSDACKNIGIDLVHILDHEWIHRQDLCKQKLLEECSCLASSNELDTVEVAEGLVSDDLRNFIGENTLEDPLDFILDNAFAVRSTSTQSIVLVITKSKSSGRSKVVKKLGIKLNQIAIDLAKQHLRDMVVEAPQAWPAESHLLEESFGMKLVGVEPPRLWCCAHNSADPTMHLVSNMHVTSDDDYLVPDAGMKLYSLVTMTNGMSSTS